MLKSIVKKIFGAVTLFIATTSLVFALDVNTATQAELDALKGIGPVKAKAIIEERSKNGNFKDTQDLSKRVKGLGDKSVSKLVSSGLTVNGSSTNSTNTTSTSKDAKKGINQSGVSGIGDGTNKNVKPSVSTEVSKPIVTKTAQEAKQEKADKAKDNKHVKELNANIKTQKENADTNTNKVKPAVASDTSVKSNAANKPEHKTSAKDTTSTHNSSTVKTQ